MSKKEYITTYPDAELTSLTTQLAFKKRGQNFAWLKRAKERGDDLTAYKAKMSVAVSTAVMANPNERKRRAEAMASRNSSPGGRELSRITAKKTSARPEILAIRTARLTAWRNTHFDEFYEKCTLAAHSKWHSKPELMLFELLLTASPYEFKHNQIVKSSVFTNKSHRKQVDIADKTARIYVEFDGIIHFEPRIKGEKVFNDVRNMDRLLDEHIVQHGWTLIRISYDQFSYKEGGKFSDRVIYNLFKILKNPSPGVFKLGNSYCSKVIPGTFIACGEGNNYCSDWCMSSDNLDLCLTQQ